MHMHSLYKCIMLTYYLLWSVSQGPTARLDAGATAGSSGDEAASDGRREAYYSANFKAVLSSVLESSHERQAIGEDSLETVHKFLALTGAVWLITHNTSPSQINVHYHGNHFTMATRLKPSSCTCSGIKLALYPGQKNNKEKAMGLLVWQEVS